MKKLRNIFLLLLIAAVSLPAVAQRTYTITGTVVDPYDGSPIEGAVVSATNLGQSVTTDANGTFKAELSSLKGELNVAFDDEQEKLFSNLKDKFKKLNIYVSPRVEISIKRYCNVAKKFMHEENKPLDYAIAQRLLPLINVQGAKAKLKLKELQELLPDEKFSISANILKDIISLGEEGEIYENQFNYFLTLSHA